MENLDLEEFIDNLSKKIGELEGRIKKIEYKLGVEVEDEIVSKIARLLANYSVVYELRRKKEAPQIKAKMEDEEKHFSVEVSIEPINESICWKKKEEKKEED